MRSDWSISLPSGVQTRMKLINTRKTHAVLYLSLKNQLVWRVSAPEAPNALLCAGRL
jgi:hypothetical protein